MDGLLSLRVLAMIADLGGFAAAADRLGLSAAMTSKHVQRLEARVGARLLNRTSRSVSLTEAGMIYLAQVRPLLEGLDEVEARLSQSTLAPRGVLRVSLPVWMANVAFARLIGAYHARYPEVTLDLDLSGRRVNLVDEGFDLALRVSPALDDTLIARRLALIRFPLVGTPGLLDRLGRPGGPETLRDAPFLAYTPVARDGRIRFGQSPDAIEMRLRPVLTSGNETLLHLATREGLGLSFMPEWLVRTDLRSGVLEAALPEADWPSAPLHAVYPQRSFLPAKVRSFLDFLTAPNGIGALDLN